MESTFKSELKLLTSGNRKINNLGKKITFPCKECKEEFGINSRLKKHIKRNHYKIKDVPCDQCENISSL